MVEALNRERNGLGAFTTATRRAAILMLETAGLCANGHAKARSSLTFAVASAVALAMGYSLRVAGGGGSHLLPTSRGTPDSPALIM